MSSKEIVLVGNGNVVLQNEMGNFIDSFDTVVRFNNFETTKYERFVGSKTDVWSTRLCATIKPRTETFKEVIGVVNWCKYTQAIEARIPLFLQEYPKATIIHSEQSKQYSKIFGYDPTSNWLSVGMITILHLLDYGYEKLHLYGFGGNPQKHYFPLSPRDPHFHKFDKESDYIKKLEKLGKIYRL